MPGTDCQGRHPSLLSTQGMKPTPLVVARSHPRQQAPWTRSTLNALHLPRCAQSPKTRTTQGPDTGKSKHQKDKENSKSPRKCTGFPVHGLSTTWGEKESHLEDPPQSFKASALIHQLNETDDFFSLSGPADTSTTSKVGLGRSCFWATSTNSRHLFSTSNAFVLPSSSAICHASFTPVPSFFGSQHVTSSGWHMQVPLSPLHLQGLDPLTTDQATELYQLAAECQALGSYLTKRFCALCSLKASHQAVAQSTMHETVLSGCQAHSTAYS